MNLALRVLSALGMVALPWPSTVIRGAPEAFTFCGSMAVEFARPPLHAEGTLGRLGLSLIDRDGRRCLCTWTGPMTAERLGRIAEIPGVMLVEPVAFTTF